MRNTPQTLHLNLFLGTRPSSVRAALYGSFIALAFLLGMASAASATPVTYAFSGILGTGLSVNADYDDAILAGMITFDDEDQVNTGTHLGYRATDWNVTVTGGNDPVAFASTGELADALTIVLNRTTDQIEIGLVEDLAGEVGGRFSNRHSVFIRFDAGLDIVTATEWSDLSASQFAPNSGFVGGTLQFSGGQLPHSFTDSSLVLVPEPGTATLLMLGLLIASSQRPREFRSFS